MPHQNEPVIIKKYSNRRLYDVTQSQHITLDDLVKLIKSGEEVQVIDSKSKEDITQSVLTQLVLDENGSYLFSAPFLHKLIRNQDGILGEFFTDFVPKMLDAYLETKDTFKDKMKNLNTAPPWFPDGGFPGTSDYKMPFFNPFAGFTAATEKKKTEPTEEEKKEEKEVNEPHDEVMELKQRLQELEARMNQLNTK